MSIHIELTRIKTKILASDDARELEYISTILKNLYELSAAKKEFYENTKTPRNRYGE